MFARTLSVSVLAAFAAVMSASSAAHAQVPDELVKIGVLTDMNGPASTPTGQGSVTAAQMAVDDFGGKVLGKPIGDDLLPEVRRGRVLVCKVNRNGDEDGKNSQQPLSGKTERPVQQLDFIRWETPFHLRPRILQRGQAIDLPELRIDGDADHLGMVHSAKRHGRYANGKRDIWVA